MNTRQGYQTGGMQSNFGPNMGYQGGAQGYQGNSTPSPSTGYSTLPYQAPQGVNPQGMNPMYPAQFGGGAPNYGTPNNNNFAPLVSALQANQNQPQMGRMMDTNATFGSGVQNANPLTRGQYQVAPGQADFGPLPPGPTGLPYGNQSGQNGLVYTNGQFGFGASKPVQLAPSTAAMLGARNNGQGQYVDAQGQVVGLV